MTGQDRSQNDFRRSPGWLPHRVLKIQSLLACPRCRSNLSFSEQTARCVECAVNYPITGGKIYFRQPIASVDALDGVKGVLKRLLGQSYYTIGVQLFAPTYPFNYAAAIRRNRNISDRVIVDLGCGNNRVDNDVVTLDAVDYEAVDIVADLASLPFRSEAVDGFVSRSVLEHVPDLGAAVAEMRRCTKPGGFGLHLIPFLFPYHASPHDYQRFTHSGAERLFTGWKLVDQRNATGPVSLLLACLAELISVALSFGNARIKSIVYLGACLLLFPLKYLDAPFVGRKAFLGIAPTILTVVRRL